MAVQEQLSWQTMASVLDELTYTIAMSKQVIKILVTELESLQSKLKKNPVVSCSNCEKSTQIMQDKETENQIKIKEKDGIDWTNDIVESYQADEIFETKAVNDSVPSDDENCVDSKPTCLICDEAFISSIELHNHEKVHDISSQTLKKLLDSGEKLYTFVGDGDTDSIDQSGKVKEVNIIRSVKGNDKELEIKNCVEKRHLKTKNKCSTCLKEFNTKYHLTRHEMIHNKVFQCKYCEKNFSWKDSLKAHELQIHSNEKTFQCRGCPKGFQSESRLKQHEVVHTGEVPFQCKTCKQRFNVKGNLTRHETIHSEEKQFHCKICDKSFQTKRNLNVHERIHTDQKPYSCKTCFKTFSESTNLKMHKRIHTGEKPYKCNSCNYSSLRRGNLKKHEKIHN